MRPSTILITGGTGKFGRQFVQHFARKGWQVLFTSTSNDHAIGLVADMEPAASVIGLECDLLEPGSANLLVGRLRDMDVEVNHLINNARSLTFLKVDNNGITDRTDFMSEYLLDVVVPYELATSLWQIQPDALQTITNISSQYGVVAANPNLYGDHASQSPIQYGVAKAAVNHLTKELAVRMAPSGIRVNAVAYGGVLGRTDEVFQETYRRMVPNGRMLDESEIPGPVDFLISEQSSPITGHVLQADGGWSIW